MRYAVVTFGCRVNQADSLAVEAGLTGAGDIAVAPDRADVVLVNTCSVTASADQGARQTIRRIAPREPGGAHRRHRLLRLALRRRGGGAARGDRRRRQRRQAAAAAGAAGRSRRGGPRRPGRSVRAHARTRADGPHRVDAAGADRVRRAVQLLHHPDDAGDEPQPHARGGARRAGAGGGRRLQGSRADWRAPRGVGTRPGRSLPA